MFVDIDWVHAGEGEAAVLTCRVLANPAPKVREDEVNWFIEKFLDLLLNESQMNMIKGGW